MVPQVADYRGKRGAGKKRRVREGGKGRVTAGSERQINGRRRERGTEDGVQEGGIGQRPHGEQSQSGGGNIEDRDRN